jgi:hypothetical protein
MVFHILLTWLPIYLGEKLPLMSFVVSFQYLMIYRMRPFRFAASNTVASICMTRLIRLVIGGIIYQQHLASDEDLNTIGYVLISVHLVMLLAIISFIVYEIQYVVKHKVRRDSLAGKVMESPVFGKLFPKSADATTAKQLHTHLKERPAVTANDLGKVQVLAGIQRPQ